MKTINTWWSVRNAQSWGTPCIHTPKGLSSRQAFFYCETYEVHIRNTSSQIARRYYDASEYVL